MLCVRVDALGWVMRPSGDQIGGGDDQVKRRGSRSWRRSLRDYSTRASLRFRRAEELSCDTSFCGSIKRASRNADLVEEDKVATR